MISFVGSYSICLLLRPRQACEVLRSTCLYVCLSTSISQKPDIRTSLNPRCMLPVAVPRSCYDGVVIRYVFPVFEKTCATTQKNVKSHVFWILKKNVKNVKNVRTVSQYTITGTGRSPTSNIVLITSENVQQWLRMDHTLGAGN